MYKINIYKHRTELNLGIGVYDVLITGGFSVELKKDFYITIQNVDSKEFLKLSFTKRNKSYVGGRSVHYLTFTVKFNGIYEVLIYNPENIIIKKSMLMSLNWILSPPSSSEKNILIVKK